MSLNMASIDPMMLGFAVANGALVLLLLGALVVILLRRYREKKQTKMVTETIIDYFLRSGVEVSVGCVSLLRDKRFTVFIESEPMKRFRLSHIIEATLRDYVQKTCGFGVEKIFWRFPIKQAAVSPNTEGNAGAVQNEDDYINEGLVHYKHLPKMEVTELPWETFEEVSTTIAPKSDSSEPSEPKETSSAS